MNYASQPNENDPNTMALIAIAQIQAIDEALVVIVCVFIFFLQTDCSLLLQGLWEQWTKFL